MDYLQYIKNIVNNHPHSVSRILSKDENEDIRNWIDCENQNKYGFELLSNIRYDSLCLQYKVKYLLSRKEDIISSCVICGNQFLQKFDADKPKKTCSIECMHKLQGISVQKYMVEKYGVVNAFQLDSVKKKTIETNLKKYGVEYSSQSQSVKEKIKSVNMERYGVEYPTQSKEIFDKIRKTNLEKYGVEIVAQSKEVLDKIRNTNIKKYGVDSPAKSELIKTKIRQTNIERFGVEYPMMSERVQKTLKKNNMKKYGVECTLWTDDNKVKVRNTMLERYGVERPNQNRDIRIKAQCKYSYCDVKFDSAPEIALYIFLKEHDIDFEYQPDVKFEYVVDGKSHYYMPDFKIGNTLIEIKGDQFFDESGCMRNPYNKNDKIVKAKYQCMLDNGIQIMRADEYKIYIDYVFNKYGKNYLKQFKNR